MEIEVIEDSYHFKYTDIRYEIPYSGSDLELYRKSQMEKIAGHFGAVLEKYGIKYFKKDIYNVINRYIFNYFSQKKYEFADPLFPYIEDPLEYDNDMKTNIEYIFSIGDATDIVKEINLSQLFIKAIFNTKKYYVSNGSVKKNKNKNKIIFDNKKVIFENETEKYELPISVYKKLSNDYENYKLLNSHDYDKDELIYSLLIRYETLFSRGNQWAMPVRVKEQYKKEFGVNFELFASSFNHFYKYYCSIFYDIEKYFMSVGFFQNVTYIRGFYMANPPYEEKLLYNMVSKIKDSLSKTDEKLSFVFGMPSWDKYEFKLHKDIQKSKYLLFSYVIGDKEVNWYDFMSNKYMRIPSNVRYVMSNDKKLNTKKIKYIFDKYWVKS